MNPADFPHVLAVALKGDQFGPCATIEDLRNQAQALLQRWAQPARSIFRARAVDGSPLENEVCELLSIYHPGNGTWRPEHMDALVPEAPSAQSAASSAVTFLSAPRALPPRIIAHPQSVPPREDLTLAISQGGAAQDHPFCPAPSLFSLVYPMPTLDDDGLEMGQTTSLLSVNAAQEYSRSLKQASRSVDTRYEYVPGHCWYGSIAKSLTQVLRRKASFNSSDVRSVVGYGYSVSLGVNRLKPVGESIRKLVVDPTPALRVRVLWREALYQRTGHRCNLAWACGVLVSAFKCDV